MDDESGELMEPMKEMPLIGLGESEFESSVRGGRQEVSNDVANPRIQLSISSQ